MFAIEEILILCGLTGVLREYVSVFFAGKNVRKTHGEKVVKVYAVRKNRIFSKVFPQFDNKS